MAGTGNTEVRPDGWCGFWKLRDDGGGCATMHKWYEGVQSPDAYLDDWVRRDHLCLVPVYFRTALPHSGGLSPEKGGMPSHDTVGVNCENGATADVKMQVSSIWANRLMLDDCAYSDWTWITPPGGGWRSWCIIIICRIDKKYNLIFSQVNNLYLWRYWWCVRKYKEKKWNI